MNAVVLFSAFSPTWRRSACLSLITAYLDPGGDPTDAPRPFALLCFTCLLEVFLVYVQYAACRNAFACILAILTSLGPLQAPNGHCPAPAAPWELAAQQASNKVWHHGTIYVHMR